jgi:hypothetical protein
MKMKLYRMLRPAAAPIIIQVDLQGLILVIHTLSKELLDARVLRIGYVWANVKEETGVVAKRCRVTAMVGVLVVHYGRDALRMEAVRGAESGHSGSNNCDMWH